MQSSLDYKWQKWRKFVSTKVSDITLTLLYMSQPALLYVTAETLVNRLMWQISTATLLLNPVILHQRGMKFFFFCYSENGEMKCQKEWRRDWEGWPGCLKSDVSECTNTHKNRHAHQTWKYFQHSVHKLHFFQNIAKKKKMLSSLILRCWAFFFDTGTRFKTHCLFVYMSPASQHCFEPYFTLTGIIDTYANRANSPRQHHILWHQRQKVDLVGWLVHVQRNALAHGHALKCSHVQQSLSAWHSTCK